MNEITIFVMQTESGWLIEGEDGITYGVAETRREAIESAKSAVEAGYGNQYVVEE